MKRGWHINEGQGPVEKLLDAVWWSPLPDLDSTELHATHEGLLRIGEIALKVYQLSNGQRVIEQESMMAVLGFSVEGEAAHAD